MRKRFVLLLCSASIFSYFFTSNVKAQVFNGDLQLTTQAQVDAFNYTSVTGNLILIGSINNLNGLSELQSIGGTFEITSTSIVNVDAMTNLHTVGFLLIRGNHSLTNLNGFTALTSASLGLRFQNNSNLANFDGLVNLTGIISGIDISHCPLQNLNGFSGLSDITGFIELSDNPFLTNLDGLLGLLGADLVNSIKIINNPLLQNINGLLSLNEAGDVIITGNPILSNIDGLANLNSLVSIIIGQNHSLTNVDGLSGIQSIPKSLWIRNNSSLTNINGLSGLTSVDTELLIDFNFILPNVNGLSNLTSIGTNLIIGGNADITNLDGLQNLTSIGNDLKIINNPDMINFCGLYNLFHSGTIGGTIEIRNNGANTISLTPPPPVVVNNDPGLCSAVISSQTIGTATPVGCLEDFTTSHSDFPAGNIFPVGVTNIIWKVTDGAGNTASSMQTVTVVDNEPPTITCPGNMTIKCASDVPAIDVNSVTVTDNCSAVVTHVGDVITNQTCANRFILTRTYMATDVGANTATCSQVITVYDDIPPQIDGYTISQQSLWPPNHTMRDITLSYTATDNCVADPIITVTVISNEPVNGTGDGDTDPDWEIIDNYHVRLRAERAANGNGRIYTITVTVDDGCNPPVSESKLVMVAHNITGPQSGKPFKAGSTVSFSGTFWDKPGNTHTAKWLLDGSAASNGIVTEPAGNQNGKVTGSYKFKNAGVYKLQMNVTDQNGETSWANTHEDVDAIVVIYDPGGGNTYGGGYFNSPVGALLSNPTATGKASYGFTMNYFKNSTNPKGETQFEFKVGEFEFNALNFDYLVISNAMAQFKGTGKIIGGQSGIGFTMTVVDGQLDGTGIDKIRMKIYNKSSLQVIYDNQPGASDASLPTQAVGLNSIIVINGANATQSAITQNAEMEIGPEKNTNVLEAIAYPNPSVNSFSVTVRSNANEKITVQVTDIYGRIIELRNVIANSTLRFGERYQAGTYLVRIVQGEISKTLKLIKLTE